MLIFVIPFWINYLNNGIRHASQEPGPVHCRQHPIQGPSDEDTRFHVGTHIKGWYLHNHCHHKNERYANQIEALQALQQKNTWKIYTGLTPVIICYFASCRYFYSLLCSEMRKRLRKCKLLKVIRRFQRDPGRGNNWNVSRICKKMCGILQIVPCTPINNRRNRQLL